MADKTEKSIGEKVELTEVHAVHSPDEPLMSINEKRLMRKIDLHIVPIMTVLYLLSFIDRANIGNAKIEGLDKTLHLTGSQYNWCLAIFFFPFSTFEIPSNLLLKRTRPSLWLPGIMVAWGLVMVSMGFVQNYGGLLATRFLLGMIEAGFKPGVIYYMSMWYRRNELQFRVALFFTSTGIAGAFSGVLAWGISFMDRKGNLEGWRWIFIIEGAVTVAMAIWSFWLVCDYPDTAKFLTKEEKAFVFERLKYQNILTHTSVEARGVEANDDFSWPAIRSAFKDWQVWLGVLLFWSCVGPLYGISLFLPTIIKDLGYKTATTQLLTVPIYVIGAAYGITVAYLADNAKKRTPVLFLSLSISLVGFIMCIASKSSAVVFAGIFFATTGVYGAHPANIAIISNNLAPNAKRAAGTGIHFALGNLAGLFASLFYRAQDSPRYILGHGLEIGIVFLGLVVTTIFAITYPRINTIRDKKMAEGEHLKYTDEELSEQGDRAVTFRYIT